MMAGLSIGAVLRWRLLLLLHVGLYGLPQGSDVPLPKATGPPALYELQEERFLLKYMFGKQLE